QPGLVARRGARACECPDERDGRCDAHRRAERADRGHGNAFLGAAGCSRSGVPHQMTAPSATAARRTASARAEPDPAALACAMVRSRVVAAVTRGWSTSSAPRDTYVEM